MEARDEDIAWPSYVDFLSTFIFVLLIFLGSLLYLMSGDIRRESVVTEFSNTKRDLAALGITDARYEGLRFTLPLRTLVQFPTGCPTQLDDCGGIPDSGKTKLKQIAPLLTVYRHCNQIILRGEADAQPYHNRLGSVDVFGNWELSNRRAIAIFKFLTNCTDCGGDFNSIRSKITLAGIGDTMANKQQLNSPDDRTVDIIVDCSTGASND